MSVIMEYPYTATFTRLAAAMPSTIFFFQADDGIRYIGVTGVQTCALPISNSSFPGGRSIWSIPTTIYRDLANCSARVESCLIFRTRLLVRRSFEGLVPRQVEKRDADQQLPLGPTP